MISYDVVEWGKSLQKMERATPKPKRTEVLLQLKYCGVCHSDAHIRDGYFELGGGQRLHMYEREMSLPITLGHEPYGTIIDAGPEAGDVSIGADRLVYPWTGCGRCIRCQQGLDNFCVTPCCIGLQRAGGYADHLLVPHPRYLIDMSDLDPVWGATFACAGLTAYSAVSKLNPLGRGEWVAVIGVGGVGLSAISVLRAMNHERIVAVDIDLNKLAGAEAAGAAATLDGRDADAPAKLRQIAGRPIYGAVDFVGSADSASLALTALRKGGRLILVGLYGGEITLSIGATILGARTIQGSHLGSLAELRTVVALARQGKLRPIPTQKRSLSEIDRTLDELKAGAIAGRVVVEI